MTIGEMLLQSHGGVVRVFPGMGKGESAAFWNFRGEGPVLVSSALKNGRVQFVTLRGLRSMTVRMKNPWAAGTVYLRTSLEKGVSTLWAEKFIEIAVRRGETVTLGTRRKNLGEWPAFRGGVPERARPRSIRFPDGSVTWIGKPLEDPYASEKQLLRKTGNER